jgi:hypothetical protein
LCIHADGQQLIPDYPLGESYACGPAYVFIGPFAQCIQDNGDLMSCKRVPEIPIGKDSGRQSRGGIPADRLLVPLVQRIETSGQLLAVDRVEKRVIRSQPSRKGQGRLAKLIVPIPGGKRT